MDTFLWDHFFRVISAFLHKCLCFAQDDLAPLCIHYRQLITEKEVVHARNKQNLCNTASHLQTTYSRASVLYVLELVFIQSARLYVLYCFGFLSSSSSRLSVPVISLPPFPIYTDHCSTYQAAGSTHTVPPLWLTTPPAHVTGHQAPSASLDLPTKPTELMAAIVRERFVTLSWRPPEHPGTSEVTMYGVFWREEGSDRSVRLYFMMFHPDYSRNEARSSSSTFEVIKRSHIMQTYNLCFSESFWHAIFHIFTLIFSLFTGNRITDALFINLFPNRERVLNTSALEANIQHLKPGTRYDFRLLAYNRAGPSPEAAAITIHTTQEGLWHWPMTLPILSAWPTIIRNIVQ